MVDDLDHILLNLTVIHRGLAVHTYDHLVDGVLGAVRSREHPLRSDEDATAEVEARVCLQRDQPLVLPRRVNSNTADDALSMIINGRHEVRSQAAI
eukprot:scaffold7766_cov157-Isochrysis_galbana.AAC.1